MNIINQRVILEDDLDGEHILKKLEKIGRVCYKSEDKITDDSTHKFIKMIINRGHESILEHHSVSIRWITDRTITHELVRSRIASYAQESQRYVNYKTGIEFISPTDFTLTIKDIVFLNTCEEQYISALNRGLHPQQAREFLPNNTKTEIVFTMNLRELRHFLNLRCSKAALPKMRDMAIRTLNILHDNIPVIFDDLKTKYMEKN